MKLRGEITVFLSLSMLCVFALLCVMVESARTAGSRYYFQMAVSGAFDMLFSQYHGELWRKYRLLGLYGEGETLIRGMEHDVETYLETENWYPLRLKDLECMEYETLTEKGGDNFAEEAEKYMEYGIWTNFTVGLEEGETVLFDIKEAAAAGVAAADCDVQERLVQKVEQAVVKLYDCVKGQEEASKEIAQALNDDHPGEFRSAARRFLREEERMEGLFQAYESRTEALKKQISESGVSWSETEEQIRDAYQRLLEEQKTVFSVYARSEEERRTALLKQCKKGRENAGLLKQVADLVEELEEDYERELAEYEADSEAESEPSLSLGTAARRWQNYAFTELSYERGKGDQEKRDLLEQVRDLVRGDLLRLVLPEGTPVSEAGLPLKNAPSKGRTEPSETGFLLKRQILLGEYGAEYFLSYGSEEPGPVRYELEYVLQGASEDRKNLEKTVSQIFLMRQGVNFLQILEDGAMRREARGLAAAITGALGLSPLTDVCACFIMGVWAMGEAVMDLRLLMRGGVVPLWKRKEEWKLSLDGLLQIGKQKELLKEEEGLYDRREGALGYRDYLKLFLLVEDVRDKQMRMLDVIQMNLRRKEEDFLLEKCVNQVDIRGTACGKHLFFTLPFVENMVGEAEGYLLTAECSRAY